MNNTIFTHGEVDKVGLESFEFSVLVTLGISGFDTTGNLSFVKVGISGFGVVGSSRFGTLDISGVELLGVSSWGLWESWALRT